MQRDLYSPTDFCAEIVAEVTEAILAGTASASLVKWSDEERNPQTVIAAAVSAFENAGWTWNPVRRHMEKDGWLIWFRSQGTLASPIAQWSRIT